MGRPFGVTILAILEFIQALVLVFGGLAFIALGAIGGSVGGPAGMFGALCAIIGVVLLIVGLIVFVIGWGLWTLRPWARKIALVFAIIGLLAALGDMTNADRVSNGVVSLLINLVILFYLTRPEIKAAFEPHMAMPPMMAPPMMAPMGGPPMMGGPPGAAMPPSTPPPYGAPPPGYGGAPPGFGGPPPGTPPPY